MYLEEKKVCEMKARENAALACRLGALILAALGLARLAQYPIFYLDSSLLSLALQISAIPFALFGIVAALLWLAALIIERVRTPEHGVSDDPPAVSVSDLTAVAFLLTGIILAAYSLLKASEAFVAAFEIDPEIYDLMKQNILAKHISALAGFAAGLALLFGGNRLAGYLYQQRN